jgi:hypothetical protein
MSGLAPILASLSNMSSMATVLADTVAQNHNLSEKLQTQLVAKVERCIRETVAEQQAAEFVQSNPSSPGCGGCGGGGGGGGCGGCGGCGSSSSTSLSSLAAIPSAIPRRPWRQTPDDYCVTIRTRGSRGEWWQRRRRRRRCQPMHRSTQQLDSYRALI